MNTWILAVMTLAAIYLIGIALIINTNGIPSAMVFKVLPMCIGLPLAFAVAGRILGWPI